MPGFAWHILARCPGRDAGRFEWLPSAQHGQAPDFISPRRPALGRLAKRTGAISAKLCGRRTILIPPRSR
ncbi:hypothetical protein BDI4_130063 [Burkholderia diffusa]|nr:hypothetical protein BDI4_130063 [Burkholderia diffusa]